MKDKLLKIVNRYGIMAQLKYLHSEYFELDEAIINYEQVDHILNEHTEDITNELADVLVMLGQIKEYYKINDKDLEKVMNYKIDRQLERIKMERLW